MLPNLSSQTHHHSRIGYGAFILIGSLFLYAIQDVFIRSVPNHISAFQIIFFRSLFALIPLFGFGVFEKKQTHISGPLLKTNYLKGHLIRAFLMFVSLCFYVIACQYVPMATLYSLAYTNPLFVTILAIPVLGERIGIYRICGVIFGFIGVLIVLQPGYGDFHPAGLLVILSGFFTGASIVMGKRLCQEDSNTLVTLFYCITCLTGSAVFLPFVWEMPDIHLFSTYCFIGITGGIAQYGFIHAFRVTDASALAPFDYVGLLWAILAGYIFWAELPTSVTLIGSLFIICGGLVTIYRKQSF